MSVFAKVIDNKVIDLMTATQSFIDEGNLGDASVWVEVHNDQSVHIGNTYDAELSLFIPIKAYSSWIYNAVNNDWEAPVAHPDDDKMYNWDESTTNWKEVI
jgi:hypothetical protein